MTDKNPTVTLRKLHQVSVQAARYDGLRELLQEKPKEANGWGDVRFLNQIHLFSAVVSLSEPLHCLSVPIDLKQPLLLQTS